MVLHSSLADPWRRRRANRVMQRHISLQASAVALVSAHRCHGSHLGDARGLGIKWPGRVSAPRTHVTPFEDLKDRSAVWPRLRIFPNGPPRSPLTNCLPASTRPPASARFPSTPTVRTRPSPRRPRRSPSCRTLPRPSASPRAASCASSSARRSSRSRACTSTADSAWARPTCWPRCGTLAPGRKAFGTFVEYTNLVGALSFRQTVEVLSTY